tara:strand:- start:486 stop:914 length:429 start_codon:yes stop_codon:yes gene_type:complete
MLRDFQMIGRIGKLDEIKMRSADSKGCEMRIACSDFKDGQESTSWFTVVAFGRVAITAIDQYNVGDQIFLSGTIDMDKWTDKTTGKERSAMKLKAFRCRRLAKGKNSSEGQQQQQYQQPQQQQQQQYGGYGQHQGGGYNEQF